jgi:hypothetical protein
MFEPSNTTIDDASDEIVRHEVSEDGVTWRPRDPARDKTLPFLHKRIEFAAPSPH